MTWNYRVCKQTYMYVSNGEVLDSEVTYAIHEVYYNSHGEITAVTQNPVGIVGDTVDEVKECLRLMTESSEKPVVDLDNIEYAHGDDDEEYLV